MKFSKIFVGAFLALILFVTPAAAQKSVAPDDPSGFVVLSEVVPDIIQEIRYYSTYNFVGDRIDGYDQPCALMTIEAAQALKAVSDDVMRYGYRLKVYDAYRPQCAVDNFVRWAENINDTRMKKYFYPEVDKTKLFDEGYITGKEVDMGGTFDYFGELSHPDYKGKLTKAQLHNRKFLRDAMIRHGFKPLDTEWWHFTLKDEPYPDMYFTFRVANLNRKQ